ncbi:MAG: iron ABC transporter permease, partial [Bacilli bacterium]|nr:iron ABC transporter permease [Bacilli bacterium]
FGKGQNNYIVIMQKIRLPRALCALFVGAGLAISGLIMQTTLGNEMAAPSTLGVANAATLGANIAIIGFAGGFLATGNNLNNYFANVNPYSTSIVAFIFAFLSVLLILGLGRLRKLPKETIILFGIALGSIWTALTSLLQFYATDVSLSAAVVWSFGDLSRATYKIDIIIIIIVILSFIFFRIFASRYNALLASDDVAKSVGVNVSKLRFVSLLIASLIVAVCVSNLGIIGFVGIICPHIAKRIFGYNHKISISATILVGAILLLFSDTVARLIGNGTAIPVGIVTSIIGAPFFLYLIFRRRRMPNEN